MEKVIKNENSHNVKEYTMFFTFFYTFNYSDF